MTLDRKRFWALRALNVGTLAGIGIATWVSKGHLAFCPEGSDQAQLMIFSGLLGNVVYKTLRSGILSFFRLFCDYLRLLEVHVLLKAKLIDDRDFNAVLHHLIGRHFGLNDNCELTKDSREKEVS
jgi:hypothetical protein